MLLAQCQVEWPDGLAGDIVRIQAAARRKLARDATAPHTTARRWAALRLQAGARGWAARRQWARLVDDRLAAQLADADGVPAVLRLQPSGRWPSVLGADLRQSLKNSIEASLELAPGLFAPVSTAAVLDSPDPGVAMRDCSGASATAAC